MVPGDGTPEDGTCGPGDAEWAEDDPAPCVLRKGRLTLDDVDLGELAEGLEGHAAWVLSHGAITTHIAGCEGPRTVSVGRVGTPVVLGMFAAAGWWAHCRSPRELQLALAAGFPAERLVASGRVKDDGFLKDALTLGVGVLETADEAEAANVARLAALLRCAVPPDCGQPAGVAACALQGCGGLLSPVLRGSPAVAVDAPWSAWDQRVDPDSLIIPRGSFVTELTDRIAHHLWPVCPGAPVDGTLEGLSSVASAAADRARIHGIASRGEWVLVLSEYAFGRPWEDPAWPVPETVMTRDGVWRFLEEREQREGRAPTGS